MLRHELTLKVQNLLAELEELYYFSEDKPKLKLFNGFISLAEDYLSECLTIAEEL